VWQTRPPSVWKIIGQDIDYHSGKESQESEEYVDHAGIIDSSHSCAISPFRDCRY